MRMRLQTRLGSRLYRQHALSCQVRGSLGEVFRIGVKPYQPGRRSICLATRPSLRADYAGRPASEHIVQISSYDVEDTIYAVSTAPGRAGIAIVRISGEACLDVGFTDLDENGIC